jgi:hypothetical protein
MGNQTKERRLAVRRSAAMVLSPLKWATSKVSTELAPGSAPFAAGEFFPRPVLIA